MKILSINLGRPTRLPGSSTRTGILKQPAGGPHRLTAAGLAGDAVCNTRHHGGPGQAVYVYTQPDYDWWAAELGRTLPPGTFGENLTLSGLEGAEVSIGDCLLAGEAILQVTAPRIPCGTLARRMEDPEFPARFRAAERPGLYCRVLQEGDVEAGQEVRLERFPGPRLSLVEVFRDFYTPELTEPAIARYLAAPVAERLRAHKERQLEKLRGR